MPVSSPYAVFRAADLNWPPRSPLAMPPVPARSQVAATPRKRLSPGRTAAAAASARRSACIQGDLFQLSPCC